MAWFPRSFSPMQLTNHLRKTEIHFSAIYKSVCQTLALTNQKWVRLSSSGPNWLPKMVSAAESIPSSCILDLDMMRFKSIIRSQSQFPTENDRAASCLKTYSWSDDPHGHTPYVIDHDQHGRPGLDTQYRDWWSFALVLHPRPIFICHFYL